MTQRDKNLAKILEGNGRNVHYSDFIRAIQSAGFVEERQSGSSHRIFKDQDGRIMNIQPMKDGKAKPYQISQLRQILKSRTQ